MPDRDVDLYFDFISPYSWLALSGAEAFGERNGVAWHLRPVVYGALLDAHGLVGPAETAAKRRYTFVDIARCAEELGLRLTGPPAHPFRSLEALRTVCLFLDEPGVLRLVVALARACWSEGRSLTDLGVLEQVVGGAGLDPERLGERIADPEVKLRLRSITEQAVRDGIFGVPTFVHEGEMFWGHDRLHHLERRLHGKGLAQDAISRADALLARPRGIDRKRAPKRPPTGSEPGA